MAKAFYYIGKTYNGATYTETYNRASRWKKILYTIPRSEEAESRPYFRHNNRRFYLDNFIRNSFCGLPTTIKAEDGEAVTLAGHEAENYYKPLFVELSEDGEAVRVYQYEGSETDYN